MRGTFKGAISFIAGEDLQEGTAVHIDWATRTIKKAFDEDVEIAICLNSVSQGDSVAVWRKDNNSTCLGIIKDTGARGADLYLDIQADQDNATGLLKFTAGTATKVFFIADGAVASANQYTTIAWKE
jgi:hypothetical protein